MSDLDARTREWYLQAEIETLYIRVSELKAENEKLDDTRIEYIGMINKLVDEREALRKALEQERERCAKIAEQLHYPQMGPLIAKEIRESK